MLASASPARLGLLRAAGLAPEVMVSGVHEDGVDGLEVAAAAASLALRKATSVADRLRVHERRAIDAIGHDERPLVVGCDSVFAFGGEVRGKPDSPEQATGWWRGYRGRDGTLVTGHAVVDVDGGTHATATSQTRVRFGCPSDAEIDAYVATGEPLAVAGAFTLDGFGAPFVDGIDGDHGTVLGLSVPVLRRLLADLGVEITDLWAVG